MSAALVPSLEEAWAARVRANREQTERLSEISAPDFYAPVSAVFVADPRRTGEPALDVLLAIAHEDETWIDIGAGAGRYALPLALRVKRVIAVEPSAGMRRALRTGMHEHGIDNVYLVGATWPEALRELGEEPVADTALIAHVGYDIEQIGPFLDAMERAARHRCVAILTDRSPASVADSFWPLVHGEARAALPALSELVELLRARGRQTEILRVDRSPRTFESVDALTTFLQRQLFLAEGGEKAIHFRAILPDHIALRDGAWTLAEPPAGSLGVVSWTVPGA